MFKRFFSCILVAIACTCMALSGAGCAAKKQRPVRTVQPAPPKPAQRRQAVDPKVQQRYYDLGLQKYSKEKYAEAKEAFRQVIEINPGNKLGLKAQENIKKINQIMKTVEEIEKK